MYGYIKSVASGTSIPTALILLITGIWTYKKDSETKYKINKEEE